MINYFNSQSRADVFVQYLNGLVADHYGALYHRKKDSPVDEDLLAQNYILGTILYACAGKFPYPESEILRCPMDAQTQLPPAESIYNDWITQSTEGMVAIYCEILDRLVETKSRKKNPNRIIITCSLAPRVVEIIGRLHEEIKKENNLGNKPKKIAY